MNFNDFCDYCRPIIIEMLQAHRSAIATVVVGSAVLCAKDTDFRPGNNPNVNAPTTVTTAMSG